MSRRTSRIVGIAGAVTIVAGAAAAFTLIPSHHHAATPPATPAARAAPPATPAVKALAKHGQLFTGSEMAARLVRDGILLVDGSRAHVLAGALNCSGLGPSSGSMADPRYYEFQCSGFIGSDASMRLVLVAVYSGTQRIVGSIVRSS